MHPSKQACWGAFLFALTAFCHAQSEATIETQLFPTSVVADGVSVVTITATVRNQNGTIVPDGTQVLFESTLGTLSRATLPTKNGLVQTQLIAGRLPGVAKVTISVPQFRALATFELPMLKDATELQRQNVFYEVSSPNRLIYSTEKRILQADGSDQSAWLKFKNIEIRADDLQLDVRAHQLKAKRAKVILKDAVFEYALLDLNLQTLAGVAIADVPSRRLLYEPNSKWFRVDVRDEIRRSPVIVKELKPEGRAESVAPNQFEFEDLIDVQTLIYARSAIAYPSREVQFRHATVDVVGTKVMTVPLFRVSTQSVRPVITEEFFQVGSNQIAVNIPYYLRFGQGHDSLVRLRYGTLFQRGVGGAGGLFLDLEQNWRQNDFVSGNFTVQGIGRKDWGLSATQSAMLTKRTKAYFQAYFPSHQALVGSTYIDHRLPGARLAYNASGFRNVRGALNRDFNQTVNLVTDPKPLSSTFPVHFSVGVSSTVRTSESSTLETYQRYHGADLSATFPSFSIGKSNVSSSGRLSYITGISNQKPDSGALTSHKLDRLTSSFSMNSFISGGSGWSAMVGYEFSDDPFNSEFLGQHRLNMTFQLSKGNVYMSTFANKSIGFDRFNLQNDFWYRFQRQWLVGSSLTLDGFQGSNYTDASFTVAYQLGYRQVGISYAQRTRRIGLEILSLPFN